MQDCVARVSNRGVVVKILLGLDVGKKARRPPGSRGGRSAARDPRKGESCFAPMVWLSGGGLERVT